MQPRILKQTLSALSVLAMLPACGGGGDFSPLTAPAGDVNKAQAPLLIAEFEKLAAAFKIDGAITPPAVSGVSFSLVEEGEKQQEKDIYADCRDDDPATPVDADDDKIPDYKKTAFDCDVNDGHANRKQVGSVIVDDLDDTKKHGDGGYKYTYDIEGEAKYNDGGFYEFGYVGYFSYKNNGSGLTYDSNYAYHTTGDSPSDGKYSSRHQSTWLHTVTPDDPADTGKSGTVVFSGFFASTTSSDASNFIAHNVAVGLASDGMKYDRTCSNYYKEGSLNLTDAQGNVISYTYACTSITKTYNNEAL